MTAWDKRKLRLLLEAVAGREAEQKALDDLGVRVRGANRAQFWKGLVGSVPQAQLKHMVFDVVLRVAKPRHTSIIAGAAIGVPVPLKGADAAFLKTLFHRSGKPTVLGQEVVDHFDLRKTQRGPRPKGDPVGVARVSPSDAAQHLASSERGGLCFEEVRRLARYVVASAEWSERDLEAYVWNHWDKIQFPFPSPLLRIKQQYRVTPKDRIDILAQESATGRYVVLELKIGDARDHDLTQLLNYMTLVAEQNEIAPHDVLGCLVARGFTHKTLGASSYNPAHIKLLRFTSDDAEQT